MTDAPTESPIAIIMPPREGFSPQAFGAVTLSVRDFTAHSAYRDRSVILGQRNDTPYEGFQYECLPVKRGWYEPNTRAYVRAIIKRLETLKPALIEVHNRPLIALKIASHTTIPIALHLHNDPQEMKRAKTVAQRKHMLSKLAGIYCISHWARMRFLDGLSQGHDKVHTTHSGIKIPPMCESKKPNIVFVGRMTPNKGGLEFAQSLARLLPNHPNWHGYMIGGRRHSVSVKLSDYEKDVLNIMDSIGDNAHFEGFYPFDQTQQMFRNSDIVVIPSLWEETFGRTGIEAIAQGCAVITSGRGGLKEIVGDDGGIIIQDVTGDTIAEAVESLIKNPDALKTLQQRAYARAQEFDIQRCTNRLDAVRDAILKDSHKDIAHAA